jgi:hypothetical protein
MSGAAMAIRIASCGSSRLACTMRGMAEKISFTYRTLGDVSEDMAALRKPDFAVT